MDYGASINDSDNPAGASPWGNSPQSSPRHNRTDFGAIGGEPPAFPSQVSSNGSTTEQDDGGFGSGEADYRRPTTASSTVSAAENRANENEPLGGQQQQHEQPRQQSQQQRSSQDLPAKHAADQAHGQQGQEQPQQHRRPPQPQFKLQAKISGLERTGRKDPILRFDVHVRWQNMRMCVV